MKGKEREKKKKKKAIFQEKSGAGTQGARTEEL